ncbi:MAG: hypothetical protein CMM01_10290 [Rhodopirellula sp.]|nr:hypothetical protein [Rhodopirellula sp.]
MGPLNSPSSGGIVGVNNAGWSRDLRELMPPMLFQCMDVTRTANLHRVYAPAIAPNKREMYSFHSSGVAYEC